MNMLYRLFLTINSVSLFVAVYLVKVGYAPNNMDLKNNMPIAILLCALYFLVPIILTALSLWLSRFLSPDTFKTESIKAVESANNQFMPTYLGYFFVALSVPNTTTFYFVFFIILVFTFFSQASYFNPLFLLFGHNFFFMTDDKGVKVFIITRQKCKNVGNIKFNKLVRINDYTFLDRPGE